MRYIFPAPPPSKVPTVTIWAMAALVLALTACGTPSHIPVNPPTPPAAVDLVSLLFSTNCRDIGGGTTVCDKIEGNRIRRTTYTPGNHFGLNGEEIHTDSLYEVGRFDFVYKDCIAVTREETRIHSTGALQALQVYGDGVSPCWISQLTALAGGPEIDSGLHEFNWTWTHYGTTTGAQIGEAAHGRVSDRTRLTIPLDGNAQLIERYEDLADITTYYCGIGSYSNPAPGGMITIRQDPAACK